MKYPVLLLSFLLSACGQVDTQPVSTVQHVSQVSYAAALSYDGNYAVVSSVENGVAFWDLQQNALLYHWRHLDDGDNLVLNLALSEDNSHVLTADQNTFALWRTNDGQNIGYWQTDQYTIRDIAVSNNGEHLLLGKSDNTVQHITLANGRRLDFVAHTERINSVAMSPNGRFALSGGNDYTAYFWDTQTAQILYSFTHPSRVTKVALDPQGRYAFTADSQQLAQIWDIQTGQRVSQLQMRVRQQIFSAVRFSQDGRYLLTGAPTRNLVLWDVQSGRELQRWRVAPRQGSRPQSAVVHAVAFLDAKRIISESSSGLAEVWKIEYE